MNFWDFILKIYFNISLKNNEKSAKSVSITKDHYLVL